jgi:SNF2 family DNA or RNA helicase
LDAKKDTFSIPMLQKFSFDIEEQYVRSSKIERIMQKLEEINNRKDGSKVVIFCHFLQMMELLG